MFSFIFHALILTRLFLLARKIQTITKQKDSPSVLLTYAKISVIHLHRILIVLQKLTWMEATYDKKEKGYPSTT